MTPGQYSWRCSFPSSPIETTSGVSRSLAPEPASVRERLLQFGVLYFGLFQDGNVRISVLPERQEVLIGAAGLTRIALQRVSTPKFEARHRSVRLVDDDSTVVDDFLEFRSCLSATACPEIRFASHIGEQIQIKPSGIVNRCRREKLQGSCGIASLQLNGTSKLRNPHLVNVPVRWTLALQTVYHFPRLGYIAREHQRRRRLSSKFDCLSHMNARFRRVANQGFAECRIGLHVGRSGRIFLTQRLLPHLPG